MTLRKILQLQLMLFPIFSNVWSQPIRDTTNLDEFTNVKKGWTFGAVPALAFDSDLGFRFGAVLNLYNYGDGSKYPRYNDYIHLNWSRTTKGSGTNEFSYDTYSLVKKVRTTFECSYLTEQSLDFYGFNGYEANYKSILEDKNNQLYQSGLFYRMDRKLLRIRTDFQGNLNTKNLKWLAGATLYNIIPDTVDLNTLNKGRSASDKYPYVGGGLYGEYTRLGLLPLNETKGGTSVLIKIGLIYDTRDNEPNPMKGIWSDFQMVASPTFIGVSKGFVRLAATHRQYFTLVPKRLSLACRLSVQNKIAGTVPFYMLPIIHYLTPYVDEDGLGGSKSLRGILRNRVVGDGVAYGNLEFRWKFLKTIILGQNIYMALSGFMDGGMVTQKYKLQKPLENIALPYLSTNDKEQLHISTGAGFHFALNENFIISADYGKSFDKRDGISGFYIGLGFLY